MTESEELLFGEAPAIVARGGVIAFRTDTFYGLGADPFNASALRRICRMKGREEGKPILLLISDAAHVYRFVPATSETFQRIEKAFWPGPVTIVTKARRELPVELTASTGTIGLRLPDDARVRNLVRKCGGALTATSANPSNQPPATSASEVEAYFGHAVDLVIDDGAVAVARPSTVLDLSLEQPTVIREGLITTEQVRKVLEGYT